MKDKVDVKVDVEVTENFNEVLDAIQNLRSFLMATIADLSPLLTEVLKDVRRVLQILEDLRNQGTVLSPEDQAAVDSLSSGLSQLDQEVEASSPEATPEPTPQPEPTAGV